MEGGRADIKHLGREIRCRELSLHTEYSQHKRDCRKNNISQFQWTSQKAY